MKRLLNIGVALLLVLLLIGYMVTYTVRFNEAAIVTTFGNIDEGSVKNAPGEGGTPGGDAGLHFKLPWPVQQVAATYDTRVRSFEGPVDQFRTADGQSVAARIFVTYRIADPLAYYRSLGNQTAAEDAIRQRVRDNTALMADYRLDQLANVNDDQVRLEELAGRLRDRIQSSFDDAGYGIEVESAGVIRILFPAEVTTAVFGRMAAEQSSLALEATSQGEAERSTRIADAEAKRRILLGFANLQASQIRTEGETAASALYAGFAEDQELAAFLAQMNSLRKILASRTRFVIDADKLYPFTAIAEFLEVEEAAAPQTQPALEDGGSVGGSE